MDTHITTAPDLGALGTPLGMPVGLPEEGHAPASMSEPDAPLPQEPPAARPRRKRGGLLATAAIGIALLGGVGAAGYLYRQDLSSLDLRHVPVPAFLSQASGPPAQPAAEVGVQPATPARRPPAAAAKPAVAAAAPQSAEFAALQSPPGSPAGEVGVSAPAPASAPAAAVPVQVLVMPPDTPAPASPAAPPVPAPPVPTAAAEPQAVMPPAVQANASVQALPAAAPPAAAAAPAPAPPSPVPAAAASPSAGSPPAARDAVMAMAGLQAAPLSPPEQVRLIDMLKEFGAQLRDTRSEVAQLQDTVAKLQAEVDAKTTSFETRLGLAEVGTVLAQSARAGHTEPSTAAASPPSPPSLRLAAAGRAVPPSAASAPAVPVARTVRDYRIQGASPGLAVLSALNPLPGGQGVIEVEIGSEVPGVGRIKSIAQRGAAWVVQTDAGVIQ